MFLYRWLPCKYDTLWSCLRHHIDLYSVVMTISHLFFKISSPFLISLPVWVKWKNPVECGCDPICWTHKFVKEPHQKGIMLLPWNLFWMEKQSFRNLEIIWCHKTASKRCLKNQPVVSCNFHFVTLNFLFCLYFKKSTLKNDTDFCTGFQCFFSLYIFFFFKYLGASFWHISVSLYKRWS